MPIPASLLRIQNNWLMEFFCPCQDLNRFQLNHNYCLAPCPSINQNNEIFRNCIDWRRWEEPILAHHHRSNFYNCVCEATPQPWKLECQKRGFHNMCLFRTSIQLSFHRQWTSHIDIIQSPQDGKCAGIGGPDSFKKKNGFQGISGVTQFYFGRNANPKTQPKLEIPKDLFCLFSKQERNKNLFCHRCFPFFSDLSMTLNFFA